MTKFVRLASDGMSIDALYCTPPGENEAADFIEVGDDVLADWRFIGGAFMPPPPPPPPVPGEISDRQFAMQARNVGFITQEEAEDFVATGTIPAALMAIIEALPEAMQGDARITIKGATTFRRDHPLTAIIGNAMRGDTALDDFLDDFFTKAAAL